MDYSSPKVLLLGISYPDVQGHMAEHRYDDDILQQKELSVEQAVECVRRKILTEMDGRDLARCVATEQAGGGHDVYTVSKEMGGIYREDRHVYASFNNSRGMRRAMDKAFGNVRFQQVILDYYWMPTGWLVTRWNKTLFQETLPDLVKHNMLAYPGTRPRSPRKARNRNISNNIGSVEMDLEEGVVFLPFCAHVCKELVGGIHKLKPYFAITFVKRSELPGHALWKGTMSIDGKVMQHRLGKRLDQEEVYCTFQPKDIYESMEDPHVNKDEVMEMLLSIEDFENIRMIRLRPLRQHEPPSVLKKVVMEPEKGGFIGLNWTMGRQRFKGYRSRKRNKPLPPPPPPVTKKEKKPVVVVDVHDSASEVETENSDFEGDNDADSDSSSSIDDEDENDVVEESSVVVAAAAAAAAEQQKGFDPYNPNNIPQITHYFPYPALDLASYMFSKDIVESDRVMAYYAKQWGPKLSRKKNKKQDLNKQDYRRFKEKQRDYLSRNTRLPHPDQKFEEGYRWTLAGDYESDNDNDDSNDDGDGVDNTMEYDADCDAESDDIDRKKGGWKLSLRGDDPDEHLVPKIVERATQDNEMMACKGLFEMKNPGYKKHSRLWTNNSSLMTCYQIPKKSVLTKIAMAQKAMERIEKHEKSLLRHEEINCNYDSEYYFDYYPRNGSRSFDAEVDQSSSSPSSVLFRFADVAATAPVLSDDFRLICKESKGLHDAISEDNVLPPFKPRTISIKLPYNLSPHENFPRELHRLLQDSKKRTLNHILCWQKEGRSFVIKNHELFEKVVLSRCCENSDATYRLFLATIMSYNFSTIKIGKLKVEYRHNLFQQGKPKRLDQMISECANNSLFDKRVNVVDQPVAQEEPEPTHETFSRKIFVANLYQLLQNSKRYGLRNALHWEDNGKSFKVHKLNNKFSTNVLIKRLSINEYDSFKSELIDRGFKCKDGKKYGIFEHPNFVKGQLCALDDFEKVGLKWRKRKRKRKLQPKSETASDLKKHKTESKVPLNLNEKDKNSKNEKRKRKLQPKSESVHDLKKHTTELKVSSNPNEKDKNSKNEKRKRKLQPKSEAASYLKKHTTELKVSSNPNEKDKNSKNEKRKRKLQPKSEAASYLKKHTTELKVSSNPNEKDKNSKNEKSEGCSNSNESDDKTSSEKGMEKLMYELTKNTMLPQVIYKILQDATEKGFSNCIRWSLNGDAFYTYEKSFFEKNFLHKYTKIRQFATFDRYLAWLGFVKRKGETRGCIYRHQHFIRGQIDKLSLVVPKVKFPRVIDNSNDFLSKGSPSTTSTSKGIKFPTVAPKNSKCKNAESAHEQPKKDDEITPKSACSDALIRISSPSSESETLVVSPERETSDRHLAASPVTISPLDDDSATDNCSSATKMSSPSLSTERNLFSPPSAKESKKRSKSSNQSRKNGKLVPANGVVECNSRSTGLLSRETLSSKKRKIDPKPRNGMPPSTLKNRNKPPARKKNTVSGKTKPSASGCNRRSEANGTRDTSQEINVAPASGSGLRSSNKVCGIAPMNSIPTDDMIVSKCKIKDKTLKTTRSILFEGMYDRNTCSCNSILHSPFSIVPADSSSNREMTNPFGMPKASRFKSRFPEHIAEYNKLSAQAPGGSVEDSISVRTPIVNPARVELGLVTAVEAMIRERLESVSLSKETLMALLSAFESFVGKDRARSLKMIVFWHAGVFVPCEESIKLLWDCVSLDNPNPPNANWSDGLQQLMTKCLLVEAHSFQLSTTYSQNWFQLFSFNTQALSNASKIEVLKNALHNEIGVPDIEPIRIVLMRIVMEHEVSLLKILCAGRIALERANEEERRRLQQEKERDEAANVSRPQFEMVHQRKKKVVGGFRCFQLPPDNEWTASFQNSLPNQQEDEAIPQNLVTAAMAKPNYYNYYHNNNNFDYNCIQNNSSPRTPMMQQLTKTNSYHTEDPY